MTEVHVVRVFTDEQGRHGNPLGVVLDTPGLDDNRRQAIATELNFSETVFVDDLEQAQLRIFTPAREIPSPATLSSVPPGCYRMSSDTP
jgi:PhzF family phenazine biosynthesis protein